MKRISAFILIILTAVSLYGCSFKRTPDTFSIQDDSVTYVEIQKKYTRDDGTVYYMKKNVMDFADVKRINQMIRKLKVVSSSDIKPKPIYDIPLVVILHGEEKDRFLILGEEWAVFNSYAYDYKDPKILSQFLDLYNNLAYTETETELTKY